MTTATSLYRLDESRVIDEYVEALFGELKGFLLTKNDGHCQRIDYLPRTVMDRLGQRLAGDKDLKDKKIVCRVVTDRTEGDLQDWEVTGSGAVARREDATYGRIKVFCALFPAGLRLAEEDSLNIATFKTDDDTSFNIKRCLNAHLKKVVNVLPADEQNIIKAILEDEAVRRLPVKNRLRYTIAVIGQKDLSGEPITWDTAGAYLYELGMIPDFKLLRDTLPSQLTRNQHCTSILADGDRSLAQNLNKLVDDKGLSDSNVRNGLAVYLADKDTVKPEAWLPEICHDDQLRDQLSFDEWKFSEPIKDVRVELNPLQDPNKPSKVTKGLVYENGTLTNDGKKPIQIRWKLTPAGTTDVGGYRIYVVRTSDDEGEVDVINPVAVPAKRKSFMVPMADNNLEDDEKCVARIRLVALDKSGVPIKDASDESVDFWIENGEEITPPPPERGKRLRHLKEVSFRATYGSGKVFGVRSRGWDAKRSNVYSVRLTNNDRGDLPLNPLLLELEREILQNPDNLGIYELNAVGRRSADLKDFKPVQLDDAISQVADDFYKARAEFFQHVRSGDDGTGVIESTDLHSVSDEALIYIQNYVKLMKALVEKIDGASGPGDVNNVLYDYSQLMRIDTVLLRVGPPGMEMQVMLLAPTHPIRVMWLFQFESLVDQWIDKMDGRKKEQIQALLAEDSIEKLVNLNVPNSISFEQGRTFMNTDNLDLFWSVLPDASTPDLRTAVNAARQAVGASRHDVMVSTVTPAQIASKIERYLCHHPYVQTLKINVINPGDGALLLEAIKNLLSKEHCRELNFNVKFFAPKGTRQELVGDAFDDFMSQADEGDWNYSSSLSETEERLLQPNENPLFPKLIYAKHHIQELLDADDDESKHFESHLTFLIDYFGTSVATRVHNGGNGSSSLYNLLAEYLTDYSSGKSTATWSRLISPNQCHELVSDGVTKKLYESHDALSHLAACFFDLGDSLEKYVTVQLELTDAAGKNHLTLLRRVHYITDWVFTIDRNFGIEYYDDPKHPAAGSSKGYLIDYTPEFLDAVSHRMIISTYHEQEIESILRFGFAELLRKEGHNEPVIETGTIRNVLQVLKSVSGKLALKLINNPTQASEVIGLALTRLALERDGRLEGRILIPVDSHIDLFYQSKQELEYSELSLKRTDLMLVELSGTSMHVDFIEVKNRRYASAAEQLQLQTEIRAKNENSEAHFVSHFVGTGETQRFDGEIKNKQLANILQFYFQRALRYGLFEQSGEVTDANIAKFYKGVEAVEAGACKITFRHEGFIFNGSAPMEREEKEVHNNRIHIIGRGGISEFLGMVVDEPPTTSTDEAEGTQEPIPSNTASEGEPTAEPADSTQDSAVEEPGAEEPQTQTSAPSDDSVSSKSEPAVDFDPVESATSVDEGTSADQTAAPSEEQLASNPANACIYLGADSITGEEVYWNPHTKKPRRLTNQHLMVVGKSGSGKSETTKALIWELNRIGVPSIILDYQGEYAFGEFYDLVQPSVFNVMDGLPINPFELPYDPIARRLRSPLEVTYRLADTLNTVFRGSGEIQLGLLREAIEDCYRQCGFDFHDQSTWEQTPPTLDMLSAVLDQMVQQQGTQARNLQIRLQPLFQSGIFQSDRAAFGFDSLFQQTSVILMTAGIKDLMLAASRFILEKVYSAMLIRGMTKELRVMLVIDEAHKLCGDETIISLVKEARKYGLGLILSSQETRDFHDSVFANTGTLVALGLEDSDATVMAKHLGLTEKKQQTDAKELILTQTSGQALIRSQHFQPYRQIQVKSFEDRYEEAKEEPTADPSAGASLGNTTTTAEGKSVQLFEGYQLIESLNSAGMSEAYVAVNQETEEKVFLKRVRVQSSDQAALEREVNIYQKLCRCQTEYVADVKDFMRSDQYITLVTELAAGGDLQDYIEDETDKRGLLPGQAKPIALSIANAVKELHDNDIVHRDLKPRNILKFDDSWKVADFGIAKNLDRLITMKTFQQHGTRGYAAPEQFQGASAAPSADIYSLGKILCFLITGQTDVDFVPFTAWSMLIRECISPAAKERPSVMDVVAKLETIPV